MNNSYYWGNSDTSVDFCEPKYQKSLFIAEYENTLSALAYVIVGFIFILFTKLQKIGLYIVFLGLATIVMHATLRYYGQWLDEASMLLLSFETIVQIKKTVPRYIFPIILAFYTYFSDTFMIFGTVFVISQLTIIYLAGRSIDCDSWKKQLLIKIYTGLFVISGIFWFLDQLYCDYIYDTFNGHALWHIGTALGMLVGFMIFLI